MATRVMGIFGIILGLIIVVMTATGGLHYSEPSKGYIGGVVLIFFGILRFLRGSSR